jgi:hypothetical protein
VVYSLIRSLIEAAVSDCKKIKLLVVVLSHEDFDLSCCCSFRLEDQAAFAVLASHEELVEAAEAKLPGSGVSRSGASSWFWSFRVLVGM